MSRLTANESNQLTRQFSAIRSSARDSEQNNLSVQVVVTFEMPFDSIFFPPLFKRAQLSASYVESAHRNIELLLKQAMKGESNCVCKIELANMSIVTRFFVRFTSAFLAPSVTMVTLMSSGCLFLVSANFKSFNIRLTYVF